MNLGDKGINLGSIVIPKVSTPQETEDIVCLVLDKQFTMVFSHCKKSLDDKTYLAMDSPVHGEPDGVSCILVEYCVRKL